MATLSSLKRLSCGRSSLDSPSVSMMVYERSIPSRCASLRINVVSKSALCATSTASPQNSMNPGSISSIVPAPMTMESLILVSFSILYGIGIFGSTKVENLSVISPPSTFTAPISMILSSAKESPVVSISNTTKVPFRSRSPGLYTMSLTSSTRYPSTP